MINKSTYPGGILLSVGMVWYIFSESDLGRHRLLRASLMNEEWIRGRDGPLMDVLSLDLDSAPISLCAHEKLFQGASLVFIPHLS